MHELQQQSRSDNHVFGAHFEVHDGTILFGHSREGDMRHAPQE